MALQTTTFEAFPDPLELPRYARHVLCADGRQRDAVLLPFDSEWHTYRPAVIRTGNWYGVGFVCRTAYGADMAGIWRMQVEKWVAADSIRWYYDIYTFIGRILRAPTATSRPAPAWSAV